MVHVFNRVFGGFLRLFGGIFGSGFRTLDLLIEGIRAATTSVFTGVFGCILGTFNIVFEVNVAIFGGVLGVVGSRLSLVDISFENGNIVRDAINSPLSLFGLD